MARRSNVTAINLTGAAAGNYNPNTSTSTTATITAKGVAVTATGVNRVYNGLTSASVNFSDDRISV
jgi:hypothetical protein